MCENKKNNKYWNPIILLILPEERGGYSTITTLSKEDSKSIVGDLKNFPQEIYYNAVKSKTKTVKTGKWGALSLSGPIFCCVGIFVFVFIVGYLEDFGHFGHF